MVGQFAQGYGGVETVIAGGANHGFREKVKCLQRCDREWKRVDDFDRPTLSVNLVNLVIFPALFRHPQTNGLHAHSLQHELGGILQQVIFVDRQHKPYRNIRVGVCYGADKAVLAVIGVEVADMVVAMVSKVTLLLLG